MMKIPLAVPAAMLLVALPAAGQVVKGGTPAPAAATAHVATAVLSAPQHAQLQSAITQHNQVRTQLSPSDRADLDKLTAHVRQQLFAAPLRGNLMTEATQIVNRTIPGLSAPEASTLAAYSLDGIATASPRRRRPRARPAPGEGTPARARARPPARVRSVARARSVQRPVPPPAGRINS
jgi:hypothetical protein